MKKYFEDIKKKLEWYPSLSISLAMLITIIFLLQPRNVAEKFGLFLGLVLKEPWRLITCHFIHFGETHYVMNTLGTVIIGGILEFAGVKRKHILVGIGVIIIFTDFVALLVQIVKPSIIGGFSGVIYGFVGMMVSIVGWKGIVALALWFFGFGFLLLGQNIAWGAHVGGFVGGLIFGKIIEK